MGSDHKKIVNILEVLLDITLQGRGAKHFFTSGSGQLNSNLAGVFSAQQIPYTENPLK